MAPKHAKHKKRTKHPERAAPLQWDESDIAGTPIESDLSDFRTPRAPGDEPDSATRFADVSTYDTLPITMPMTVAPPTPSSDLTDAGTPRSMYKAPPTTFTTDKPAHLKQPQPVRGVSMTVSGVSVVSATADVQQPVPVRRDTTARDAVLSPHGIFLDKAAASQGKEDHICTATMLFVAGALLGSLMNGFSLLLGTLLHGKRRRNYVIGSAFGAVTQISIIIVVLVYAVPMTGPAGVLFRTEASS